VGFNNLPARRELAKSGVTLSLLWNEYCEECRLAGELPLMYTQFCLYYREFAQKTKATMHINRKPGERMEVDWAGQTAKIIDTDTGEEIPAQVFVAVLSSNQYAYVEAFLSQNQECWIAGHVNAFKFFGGVTRMLVPDNLRTGVQKPSRYTPEINRTYQELCRLRDYADQSPKNRLRWRASGLGQHNMSRHNYRLSRKAMTGSGAR
jgi:transposase